MNVISVFLNEFSCCFTLLLLINLSLLGGVCLMPTPIFLLPLQDDFVKDFSIFSHELFGSFRCFICVILYQFLLYCSGLLGVIKRNICLFNFSISFSYFKPCSPISSFVSCNQRIGYGPKT